MNNNNFFSQRYLKRKALVMKNLERYEAEPKPHRTRVSLKLAVAIAICTLLAVSVFAVTEFSFFKIFRDNTKTVISVGSGTFDNNENKEAIKYNNGYYTFASDFDIEGDIPSLIFHRDYMPKSVGSTPTEGEIKYGDFDSGTAMSFSLVYLGGKNYTYNFGSSATIENLTVNGHSAIIIRLDEATYFNRILAVYFEEHDVLVDCYLGYAIPESEITKLAEGFRLEKTDDLSLAWQITRNTGGMTHSSYIPESTYLPLEISNNITLNETITLSEGTVGSTERKNVDIKITPLYTAVLDDVLVLDKNHYAVEKLQLFTNSDGSFIPYPRTEIIKSPDGRNIFGKTESVKKKLVTVTLCLKNTSDSDVTTCIGSAFNLHVGNSESLCHSYVYDNTPSKYTTTSVPFYYDAGGLGKSAWITDFSAGEEKICTVGFLVDEDMLDMSYLLIGNAEDIRYNLKLN